MAAMTISRGDPFEGVSMLNDRELTVQVEQLNQRRQGLDAELLLHLSELDHRGLYRDKACSSLFVYCTERLGFSEGAAFKRVSAARLLRQFPLVYELLLEGKIHVSALLILKPHLNEENHEELLLAACGMSKRAVERLVAAIAPRPDVPTRVRRLPEPKLLAAPVGSVSAAGSVSPVGSASAVGTDAMANRLPSAPAVSEPTPQASALNEPVSTLSDLAPATHSQSPRIPVASAFKLEPLSLRSYRVVFTGRDTFKRKLDRARELLSHTIAPSDLSKLLERALDLLIEYEEKRRFAIGAKSRRKSSCELQESKQVGGKASTKHSRYIPAAARREIWRRDQGRCSFVDTLGRRCNERHFLEIEHRLPHALHGPSTVENCELLCRSHNVLRAEEVFGRGAIAARIERERIAVRECKASLASDHIDPYQNGEEHD